MAVISLAGRRADRPPRQRVEDRARDAVERWTRTLAHCQRSRWLINSSRATLDRQRPGFSGGAESLGGQDAAILSRLRGLIDGGVLPDEVSRGWVGPCLEHHRCIACEDHIPLHDTEFEWESTDGPLFFHRRCFDLWRGENRDASTRR